MGARKKSTARKPAGKRPAGAKATARKPAEEGGSRKKKGGALRAPSRRPTPTEELAKRIVAAMDDEFNLDLGKFYTEDAVSEEPAGGTTTGLQSLRSKLAGWLAGLRSAQWKARNVFVSGKAICIEWDADIVMKDGRNVKLTRDRRARGARRQDLRRAVLLRPARPDAAAAAGATARAGAPRAATAADAVGAPLGRRRRGLGRRSDGSLTRAGSVSRRASSRRHTRSLVR